MDVLIIVLSIWSAIQIYSVSNILTLQFHFGRGVLEHCLLLASLSPWMVGKLQLIQVG